MPMSAIRLLRLFGLAALLATAGACATGAKPASDDKPKSAVDRGRELLVSSSCTTCHGVTKEDTGRVGPTLFGIVGRKAGTAKSALGASDNLKKYGVIWTVETLDEFLANPLAKLPFDTPMLGILKDPQQRADVIAYLATLKE